MADPSTFMCRVCGKVLDSWLSLQIHELNHSNQISWNRAIKNKNKRTKLKCDLCQKQFRTKAQVQAHTRGHLRGRYYFFYDESLPESYRVHKIRYFQLQKERLTKNNDKLSTIVQPRSLKQVYTCDLCQEKLHTFYTLKTHFVKHVKGKHITDKGGGCSSSTRVNPSQQLHLKYGSAPPKNWSHHRFDCDECGKVFSTKTSLNSHKGVHRNFSKLICDICGIGFHSLWLLQYHWIQHIDGSADSRCFVQTDNDVLYGKERESYLHVMRQTSRRVLKCEHCQASFISYGLLAHHLLVHIGVLSYTCHMCDVTKSNKSDLIRHLENHMWDFRNKFPSKCEKCSCRFIDIQALNRHLIWHEQSNFLHCTICQLEFPNINELINHMKAHIDTEGEYCCYVCGKPHRTENKLLNHYASTHVNGKQHVCVICGKFFGGRPSYLSYHYEDHSGLVSPVYCEVCGRSFQNQFKLTQHKTRYCPKIICPVCKKMFSPIRYNQHKKTHSNDRPFLCNECGKSFRMKHQLKDHLRIHSGERPFQCQTCKQSFKVISHLKQHIGTLVCEQNALKSSLI